MPEVKRFLTYDEQVQHLLDVGLEIDDKEFAKNVLSQINYYRLINAYSLGLYVDDTTKDRYKRRIVLSDLRLISIRHGFTSYSF